MPLKGGFSKFHFSVFSLFTLSHICSNYICKRLWISIASKHTHLSWGKYCSNLRYVQPPKHIGTGILTDLKWHVVDMEKARGIGPVSYAKPQISVYMCLYFVFACLTIFLLIFAALPSSQGAEVCREYMYMMVMSRIPRDWYWMFTVTKYMKLIDYLNTVVGLNLHGYYAPLVKSPNQVLDSYSTVQPWTKSWTD